MKPIKTKDGSYLFASGASFAAGIRAPPLARFMPKTGMRRNTTRYSRHRTTKAGSYSKKPPTSWPLSSWPPIHRMNQH